MSIKPLVIGVTMGDPAGIGPEITTALLAERIDEKEVRAVLIGCAKMVEETARRKGLDVSIRRSIQSNHQLLFQLTFKLFQIRRALRRTLQHTPGKIVNSLLRSNNLFVDAFTE